MGVLLTNQTDELSLQVKMATTLVESRSCSSLGYKPPHFDMGVVNTETRLAGNVLSQKFVKELEHYYDKANIHDKAKCLQLITSVKLGDELRRQVRQPARPKTAMPAFGFSNGPSSLNPYSTTYTREYVPKAESEVNAIRPMTSDGYATQVPYTQPMGPTTYDVEFARKFQRPASPERIGTASGNRSNKPHPPKEFMVWKFPKRTAGTESPEKVSPELTNQKLNQITKRLCHSVYQNDYLGIPQGFQVRSAYNLPPDWKENVGYDMDSNQRESYQVPFQQRELLNPTTRYAANNKKVVPAVAVIPTANKRMFGINTRTTYDRHFNDNAARAEEQIRDVGRKLGAEALKKHYNQTCGEDRDLIGQLIEEYGGHPSPKPPSFDRPICPSPPAGSRCSSSAKTPALRLSHGSSMQRAKSARKPDSPFFVKSRSSSSAHKLRPAVPAATVITFPHNLPFETKMPTTPLSVPYSPPGFLS